MTKKQITELNEIIQQVPADKRVIAANLVEEIVFMYETMEDLKSKIRQYGTVELFEQGKITPMHVDYEAINRNSIEMVEALLRIAGTGQV